MVDVEVGNVDVEDALVDGLDILEADVIVEDVDVEEQQMEEDGYMTIKLMWRASLRKMRSTMLTWQVCWLMRLSYLT